MAMVHIYCGNGVGKTTAAVGLSVRFAGSGGKVLFCQFMKSGTSSELNALSEIPSVTLFPCYKLKKFSFDMSETEKEQARREYTKDFIRIGETLADNIECELVVFDELLSCIETGFLDIEAVIDFLKYRRENLEVVMTGRNPDKRLCEIADYISEIKCVKHPFEQNVSARIGIEF